MTQDQWQAIKNHDKTSDGKFFYTLKGSRTVCRPSCRMKNGEPKNIIIYTTLEEALRDGYRPCQKCCPDNPAWEGARQELVKKARLYVEENYREKFSLDYMAAFLCVDKNYLLRTFRELSGMTLLSYHNHVRCTHARELLQRPNLSEAYIAEAVGFKTASHFIQVYKRCFGETPRQYQKAYYESFEL